MWSDYASRHNINPEGEAFRIDGPNLTTVLLTYVNILELPNVQREITIEDGVPVMAVIHFSLTGQGYIDSRKQTFLQKFGARHLNGNYGTGTEGCNIPAES